MTANWVLLTLLISLCLPSSYGKRTGVSAMVDGIEKYPCQSSNPYCLYCDNVNIVCNSGYYVDNSGVSVGIGVGPSCTGPSCGNSGYVGSGFCGDSCSCGYNPCSIDYGYSLEGLKQTIRDLTMKLDANGLLGQKKAMNMKAMAPESS